MTCRDENRCDKLYQKQDYLSRMIIKESITIHSTVEKVWNTFNDLTRWTERNTVMSDIVCNDQCLVNGKDIKCCFRPLLFPINVKIKIQEIIPFNHLVCRLLLEKKKKNEKIELYVVMSLRGVSVA